jgi:hypothetical protein
MGGHGFATCQDGTCKELQVDRQELASVLWPEMLPLSASDEANFSVAKLPPGIGRGGTEAGLRGVL